MDRDQEQEEQMELSNYEWKVIVLGQCHRLMGQWVSTIRDLSEESMLVRDGFAILEIEE